VSRSEQGGATSDQSELVLSLYPRVLNKNPRK
jgi:hypothetical protein